MMIVVRDKKGIKSVAFMPMLKAFPGDQSIMAVFRMAVGVDQYGTVQMMNDGVGWQAGKDDQQQQSGSDTENKGYFC